MDSDTRLGDEFGKGHIVGELDITPSLWFFDCLCWRPGDAGLPWPRRQWQMIGCWLGWSGSPGKGRAIGVGEVEFRGQVTPDARCVRFEVHMRQARRGRLVLGIANGRVLADDTCVYVARDMRVGLTTPAT